MWGDGGVGRGDLRNERLHHHKNNALNTPTGLNLVTYTLSYPKAISDRMQKEIRHKKQTKQKEEMNGRSNRKKILLWSFVL